MAAVASNSMTEGFRGSENERFAESSPSRFTAVNGHESPAPIPKADTSKGTGRPGEEAESSKLQQVNEEVRANSSTPERTGNPVQQPSPGNKPRGGTEQRSLSLSPSPNPCRQQAEKKTPQKRKRSYPDEPGNVEDQVYRPHGGPRSPTQLRLSTGETIHTREASGGDSDHRAQLPRERASPAAEPYARAPSTYSRVYDLEPVRGSAERADYDPHPQKPIREERPYLNPQADVSESHLAEALQRENRGYSSGPRGGDFASPEDEEEPQSHQYGDYGTNRSSQSGVEVDRKRRKRVFSNRTKTGCMTCRKRKKKCDEQHPECNNCLRGGFVCEGYSMRNTWQKPSNNKGPVPLQSKLGYADTPSRPPQISQNHSRYANEVGPEFPSRPPPLQKPMPASDGDRIKPIVLEEEQHERERQSEPSHLLSSPPGVYGKPTWSKAARPYPSNPPHISKYQPESDHRNSIHDIPHEIQDHVTLHPPSASQRHTYSQPAVRSAAAHNSQSAPAVAQAALQHTTSLRPSPQRRLELTEREKMLKGEYYLPFSPALIEDRERCAAAIWRFNNSTNPNHGVSPEERSRLFKAILTLRPSPEPTPSVEGPGRSSSTPSSTSPVPLPIGSVGERVVVEAPFHCDYGYNISIGDDVLIGAECRISDTCSVSIGARCIFSPNVKLVCAGYAIDPRRRMGSQGQALGRNIVIEDDCWIGSNVTILLGVRIGKSSTVAAGSVIHKDVPRFTVVAGNPQKVVRGIYDGNNETT